MEETCWWTLDDGSGTTATDLSAYENDGVLTNMESGDWKSGKIGDYALEFDGIDEFVDCGNEYYLDFERNNTFTLSAWIKTASVDCSIISKMNVSDNYRGYDLYCNENGKIRAHLISTINSNELIVYGSTTINDNQWHFIVMTYDSSSNATGVKLYIDGALDNLTTIANTLNQTIHTNTNFLIGARTDDDYFTGLIDDIRVYSYDLSQDNVTWLYNSGNGRPIKPLNGDSEPVVSTQYQLEIPYVGVVYDANLTISITSEGTSIGEGNITVEIIKEEINCSIANVVLSSALEQFSNTSQFSYEKFIDITPYVNNNTITEFYGKYLVSIGIEGTDYRDKFIITEFFVQTDTFVEAGPTDTEAWCTNPAKSDTDDDGWSDYKEIYVEQTNPLSCDTDGDQVWDPNDRDPLQDVMLKITPISGSAPSDYKLKMVIKFTVDGTGDTYYIPILKQKADVYENPLWTAYYDGTHESSTELYYYVNINDDNRLPNMSDLMRFDLELWRVDRYFGLIKKWDKKLVAGDDYYSINEPGYSETLKVDKKDGSEQVIYEAKVKVETIGIEKANTIAIYETNGTVFDGHYQEQERMNVIQLYVNDSGSGTPFEDGLNTIVIPTSLFTETIFNAHVQNETLNETTIYRDDEELFKFISVGRDGETEQACDEIDFIIIRFDISSEDAMEVLNLLLECLVNETTNETAIVYSYVSTKENGTAAVMMNLPFSVLGLIPWYCDFENSPMGSKPETFEDWFWKPLAIIGLLIVGVIITIGMAFVELFMMMIEFFATIFMDILPILGYIFWLIICAIILIFAYIVFVITLLIILIVFLLMGLLLTIFKDIIHYELNCNTNQINFQKENIDFRLGYILGFTYFQFFKIYLPTIIIYFENNETRYEDQVNLLSPGFTFPTNEIAQNLLGTISSEPLQSSGVKGSIIIQELKTSSTDSSNENIIVGGLVDIASGFSAMLTMHGSIMSTATAYYHISPSKTFLDALKTSFSCGFLYLGITLFLLGVFADSPSIAFLLGIVLGIWISHKFINLADDWKEIPKSFDMFIKIFGLPLSLFGVFLSIWKLQMPNKEVLFTLMQIPLSIIVLLGGTFFFSTIDNESVRNIIGGSLILIGWIISIVLLIEMIIITIKKYGE
ncbi:MAG: LamG domain-containing protein [Promethearchaeota archaeon]